MTSYTLSELRNAIPFHGGGITLANGCFLLPEGYCCDMISLDVFQPIYMFEYLFREYVNHTTRLYISKPLYDKKIDQLLNKTVKDIKTRIRYMVQVAYKKKGKINLFSSWLESYLSAFFFAILEDFSLYLRGTCKYPDDENFIDELFFDNEYKPLIPSKKVVEKTVRNICENFRQNFDIFRQE